MGARTLRIIVAAVLLSTLAAGPTGAANAPRQTAQPAAQLETRPGTRSILREADEAVSTYVGPPEAASGPRIAAAQFDVTYVGFPPDAQASFAYAIGIWSSLLTTSVPIRVRATWTSLGNGILGGAGPAYSVRNFPGAPLAGTWYSAALANKLAGADLDTGAIDIEAEFNSDYAATWYYGSGATPMNQLNFASVVLHEIGHGLGFSGTMSVSGGLGSWGDGSASPDIYDRYTTDGSGLGLLDTTVYPNPSAALAAALRSGAVRFAGPAATAAAGGTPPRLYAPSSWQTGSSYSHLDETAYPAGNPNSLMTPSLARGEAVYAPGPIALGVLADLGWGTTPAPPPAADTFPGTAFVGLPTLASLATDAATTEAGEPQPACAPGPVGKTVWHSFTPTATTGVILSTVGSSFDTVVAVYTGGSVGGLTPVAGACNDDGTSDRARVTFVAQAGVTYRIQVGGFAGAGGALSLAATVTQAAIPLPIVGPAATLTLAGGGATVQAFPAGEAVAPGVARYPVGTGVLLAPQPPAGQTFTGWLVDGQPVGWAWPLTVTLAADHSVAPIFAPTRTFADTGPGRADFKALVALASRGTILGFNSATYGPDQGVQRAQMAALIARAMPNGPGTPTGGTLTPPNCVVAASWDCEDWGNTFQDRGGLDANLWRNVGALGHYGVAKGYAGADCAAKGLPSPCFAPTAPVSYVETIAFIARAMIARGYWVAQSSASLPYSGVPAVLALEVRTFAFYTGGVPASPTDWNAAATRGWFARALWQALNSYWGTDGLLADSHPAGGYVP